MSAFIQHITKLLFGMSFLLISIFTLNPAHAQQRLILNNDAYLRIDDSAFFVIDNSNSNALITSGTGGNIISANENNVLLWNIKNATGNYVIPFTSLSTKTKIPMELNITAAGTGDGQIGFSSYETNNDNNETYPLEVTHMGFPDNSLYAVDRFWIIDSENYAIEPDVTLSFTYDDNPNEIGGTNLITETNLQAQRFNPAPEEKWGDYIPGGVHDAVSNKVTNVIVPSNQFYKTWTLVEEAFLLPIELISFEGECINNGISFQWTTAAELNNSHFTIEQSVTGNQWHEIATIIGAGSSSEITSYNNFISSQNSEGPYFRLKQTDFDGAFETFTPIYMDCFNLSNQENMEVYSNGSSQPSIGFTGSSDENYTFSIYSVSGNLVQQKQISNASTKILISVDTHLSNGLYFAHLESQHSSQYSELIIMGR